MENILHIYTRVSSAVQQDEGTSLEAQRVLGQRKADELGFLHKVWNEGGQSSFSDDLKNRPVLVSLLRQIEQGAVKNLFVYNTDRLSRNQRTWALIRYKLLEHGVTLHTVSGQMQLKNPVDDLLLGILSEISQYDNRIRAERSRMGRFHKVQLGSWKGGPPPFGYRLVDRRLEVDPFESEWIRRMFDWYAKGVSIKDIQCRLSRNGVVTRRGNAVWSLGSIQLILRNPVYVGYFDYTDKMIGKTVRITSPALINASTFQSVQDRRTGSRNRRVNASPLQHFYLLRGLLVCGHCGTFMGGRINRSGHQNFYYCAKKERVWKSAPEGAQKWVRGRVCSMTRSVNIDRTDKQVLSMISSIIRDIRTWLPEKTKLESNEWTMISGIDRDLIEVLTADPVTNIEEMPREGQRDLIRTVVSSIRVQFDGKSGKHAIDLELTPVASQLLARIDDSSKSDHDRQLEVGVS